jgi:hypothetical protein
MEGIIYRRHIIEWKLGTKVAIRWKKASYLGRDEAI